MKLTELAQTILESKDIRKKTYDNYTGALRRNVYPNYGNRDIKSLSKFEFAQVLSKLPPQTSYQTLMALRSIFRTATKDWTAAGTGEANVAVINGVAKLTFYAPLTAGPVVVDLPVESAFNLSGTITKLTTTVNIADANQAAITASLAALNAKIVALNALIAKIMKRLNIR